MNYLPAAASTPLELGRPQHLLRGSSLRHAFLAPLAVVEGLLSGMAADETPLQMALRHVCEGEARVARQSALVDRIARSGRDPSLAIEILVVFKEILSNQRAHLANLLDS